ncbi:MAG TPA: GNAT family N-acetyltransferase [Halobacteriales archaeon]|uniref:GNAT family N-acetyltransferase n=1 Tax=Candidatus Hikarchaeum yamanae TaxID=2675326 RepID=UPI001799ECFD|nr:GNAT family N-acetyltransferase [Halobacteriales archaeon]|tara:strand:+ start:62496 stop:63077 length:582 start_codon:yes stop_codon:yes gene_type:complete
MYVRAAKNRDELWLLDQIESLSADDVAFRSRDYVISIDSDKNSRLGFGRNRIHKEHDEEDFCEITSICILDDSQKESILAQIFERLTKNAQKEGFDESYFFTKPTGYLSQLGFDTVEELELSPPIQHRLSEKRDTISPKAVPLLLKFESFKIPPHIQATFDSPKSNVPPTPKLTPEDFGINPEKTSYKYSTRK